MRSADKVLLPAPTPVVTVPVLTRLFMEQPVARSCIARSKLQPRRRSWLIALYGMIIGGICAYAYADYQSLDAIWQDAEQDRFFRILFLPAAFWAVAGTVLMSIRTFLWIRYRPFAAASLAEAPALSVVIPAYNEGAMVLKSIESVVSARYPAGRLEVLVVDDGSKDDTWEYISRAEEQYPQIVTAVRFPQNRGKRAALACGFERARGELVATLDSDSVIEPDALLALVGPFRNPRIGAVAGKVVVYNRREGLIPRMLHVRFLLTFDVLRAGESAYRTVYCCPGALTAYRVSAVRAVLPRWLEQSFLGSRCTFGEDRALTNYLLDEGFDTVYQGSAAVHTVVPVSYAKLCRMFLRWDRSYVREELRFLKIVWKRPRAARWIALFDRVVTNLQFPIGFGAVAFVVATCIANPPSILRFLLVMGFVSLLSTLYILRSESSPKGLLYGMLFAYYSAFTMMWIMPFAFFTVRARSWLTR